MCPYKIQFGDILPLRSSCNRPTTTNIKLRSVFVCRPVGIENPTHLHVTRQLNNRNKSHEHPAGHSFVCPRKHRSIHFMFHAQENICPTYRHSTCNEITQLTLYFMLRTQIETIILLKQGLRKKRIIGWGSTEFSKFLKI